MQKQQERKKDSENSKIFFPSKSQFRERGLENEDENIPLFGYKQPNQTKIADSLSLPKEQQEYEKMIKELITCL